MSATPSQSTLAIVGVVLPMRRVDDFLHRENSLWRAHIPNLDRVVHLPTRGNLRKGHKQNMWCLVVR